MKALFAIVGLGLALWGAWLLLYSAWEHETFPRPLEPYDWQGFAFAAVTVVVGAGVFIAALRGKR